MQRIRIRLKGFESRTLDQCVEEIIDTAKRTGAKIAGPVPLPTKVERFCVERSVHINKKSREQFEMRIHRRFVEIKNSSQQIIGALSSLSLPSGVGIEIKQL